MATPRTPQHSATVAAPVLIALGALTILGPLGTDAYLPALPTMADELGAAPSMIQLCLTGFTLGMALGQLFAGPLSDGAGRRRPLLLGSAATALASAGSAFAPNLIVLVACCAAMGLGASFGLVVSRAVLSDLVDGPALTRSYALLGTLTALGPIIGPIAGVALLYGFGWRGVFVGLAVFAGLCLAAVALLVRESLPVQRRIPHAFRSLPRNTAAAFRSRTYLGGATVIWFAFGGLFAYIAASPFLIQDVLGLSPFAYSVIFGINGAGLVVGGILTARLSARWSERALMALGLGLEGLGAFIVLVCSLTGTLSAWTLLPALFLIASCMGFVFGPGTSYALHGLHHIAGTALAVIGAVQFVGAGLVAPLVELGGDQDPLPFAIVVTVCVGLAWIGWAVFREPRSAEVTEGARHGTA